MYNTFFDCSCWGILLEEMAQMQASFEDDWRQKLQHLQSENLLAKII